ncbi:MAG: lysylphosphatidylglycerol synthase domain-containing protein [Dehalococcoidia bacterium]
MPSQLRNLGPVARGLIGFAIVAVIFYFLGRELASNFDDLKSEDIDLEPGYLVLAVLLLVGDLVFRSFAWTDLLAHYAPDARHSQWRLGKVFVYSWMGRYVPGKVPYVLGRFYLGRSIGYPSRALVGTIAYENILLLLAALALASVTLIPSLAVESESVLPYIALPIVAIAGVLALQPSVLRRGLVFVLRLVGREAPEQDWFLPPSRMARAFGLYLIAFCLSGAGFYFLIVSLTPYSVQYLPLSMGTFTLAGVIGMISLFAPAGLGVREGFLVGLLQFTMPVELAIVVSLAARGWATAVDLLAVGVCFASDHLSGDRVLTGAVFGRGTSDAGSAPSEADRPAS